MATDPDPDPDKNKAAVVAFNDLVFNQGRPAKAVRQYAGDGKNVEHWDVLPPVPDAAADPNTMF